MEGDSSLPAKETSLHIYPIIRFTLLKAFDISLELHLLSLEIVTGIKLIAAGDGNDIQFS